MCLREAVRPLVLYGMLVVGGSRKRSGEGKKVEGAPVIFGMAGC